MFWRRGRGGYPRDGREFTVPPCLQPRFLSPTPTWDRKHRSKVAPRFIYLNASSPHCFGAAGSGGPGTAEPRGFPVEKSLRGCITQGSTSQGAHWARGGFLIKTWLFFFKSLTFLLHAHRPIRLDETPSYATLKAYKTLIISLLRAPLPVKIRRLIQTPHL